MKQIQCSIPHSSAFVLPQGCFMRDPTLPVVRRAPQAVKYVSEEVTTDYIDGESRRYVEKDYPITPEFVKSFVEITDYKTTSSNMAPRQNLGDVRAVQDTLARGDTASLRAEHRGAAVHDGP